MKYVIVGYTSDIDIKTNTAKIRYAKIHFAKTELNDQIPVLDDWSMTCVMRQRFI